MLAAPYLRIIEASGTPCILFVNRMDEPRGRLRDVIAALQDYAGHTLLLRQIPIREGDKIVIGVSLHDLTSDGYAANQIGIKDLAASKGNVEIKAVSAEGSAETQISQIEDLIITDDGLDPAAVDEFRAAGVNLVVAERAPAPAEDPQAD